MVERAYATLIEIGTISMCVLGLMRYRSMGALTFASRWLAVSSGVLLFTTSSAVASGQDVIPYFLGAIAFTFAFTYVVYRLAGLYSERPGMAATSYFVAALATWFLAFSIRPINELLGGIEDYVMSLLPELDSMSFTSNFVGTGLAAIEVVVVGSCIAVLVVCSTRRRA